MLSVDDILTTSYEIPTKPLTPTSSEDEPEVIDLTESDTQEDPAEAQQEVTEVNQPQPVSVEGAVGGKEESDENVVQDENGNNSSTCTTPDDENKDLSKEEMEKEKTKRGREGSPR